MGNHLKEKKTIPFVVVVEVLFLIALILSILSLPSFNKRFSNQDHMIIGNLISLSLVFVNFMFSIAGSYLLLKNRQRSEVMVIALIIASLQYHIDYYKFAFLPLNFGFTMNFKTSGFGINFVGALLLIWYLILTRNKNQLTY